MRVGANTEALYRLAFSDADLADGDLSDAEIKRAGLADVFARAPVKPLERAAYVASVAGLRALHLPETQADLWAKVAAPLSEAKGFDFRALLGTLSGKTDPGRLDNFARLLIATEQQFGADDTYAQRDALAELVDSWSYLPSYFVKAKSNGQSLASALDDLLRCKQALKSSPKIAQQIVNIVMMYPRRPNESGAAWAMRVKPALPYAARVAGYGLPIAADPQAFARPAELGKQLAQRAHELLGMAGGLLLSRAIDGMHMVESAQGHDSLRQAFVANLSENNLYAFVEKTGEEMFTSTFLMCRKRMTVEGIEKRLSSDLVAVLTKFRQLDTLLVSENATTKALAFLLKTGEPSLALGFIDKAVRKYPSGLALVRRTLSAPDLSVEQTLLLRYLYEHRIVLGAQLLKRAQRLPELPDLDIAPVDAWMKNGVLSAKLYMNVEDHGANPEAIAKWFIRHGFRKHGNRLVRGKQELLLTTQMTFAWDHKRREAGIYMQRGHSTQVLSTFSNAHVVEGEELIFIGACGGFRTATHRDFIRAYSSHGILSDHGTGESVANNEMLLRVMNAVIAGKKRWSEFGLKDLVDKYGFVLPNDPAFLLPRYDVILKQAARS